METAYMFCAAVGGTLIVCQFILTLIGLGGDHDVGNDVGMDDVGDFHGDVTTGDVTTGDHDISGHSDTNWIFGIITFRTIVAGIAFFGFTGLSVGPHTTPTWTLIYSLLSGSAAILIVAWIMRSIGRLNIDGTFRIQKAKGAKGTVYLTIPGAKGGTGKVHVFVQNRMLEFKAITSYSELPTGTKVVVVNIVGGDTVEVSPVETMEISSI